MDRGTDSSGAEPELNFQHFTVPLADGHPVELGRGAMGVTYKAYDRNLRMPVALKVINSAVLASETARERFLREARSAAALRHPNVAAVFFLGEQDGGVFYAMEFVDGETVEAAIRRDGGMPAVAALRIVSQVASALAAAEKEGIVHRDIKPSNIMLVKAAEGGLDVKVIDFGLAKSIEATPESATVTLTQGGFLGTPHFASPEQLEEGEVDTRSDIYSLGVTLFYMLAGKTPFSGSMAQVMSQHLYRQPPVEALEGQPPAVMALLSAMLAKRAEDRPPSALDLKRRVDACLGESTGSSGGPALPAEAANFPSKPGADARRSSGRKAIFIGAGVLGLVVALGLGIVLRGKTSASLVALPPSPTATPLAIREPKQTPAPKPPAYADEVAQAGELELADDGAGLAAYAKLAGEHPADPGLAASVDRLAAKIETAHPEGLDGGELDRLRPALEAAGWLGNPHAQALLGSALLDLEPAMSLYWNEAAARQGRTDAMVRAGMMLSSGHGVAARDYGGAAAWFEQAARRNDSDGMTLLAECHLRGKGTNIDPQRALELLMTATALGNDRAMDMLGGLYRKGDGVEKDPAHAAALFKKASAAGNLNATANLGVLYMKGEGIAPDAAAAAALWKKGAEKGHPRCMYFYACSLEEPGATNDPREARRWFVEAAEAGEPEALKWCEDHQVALGTPPGPGE